MTVELRVPTFGESINEVVIGDWLKSEGQAVDRDESVVVIETEKVTSELPSPVAGKIVKQLKSAGDTATVGEVIAIIEEVAAGDGAAPAGDRAGPPGDSAATPGGDRVMPAARRELAERGLKPGDVQATGPGGRVLKEDVVRAAPAKPAASAKSPPVSTAPQQTPAPPATTREGREEKIVPMSLLRRRVAERLVEAQQTAALLTTFNEIDLTEVIALRKRYQDAFQEKYGTRLGFMSFFVKAAIEALRLVPGVNAEIRGTDIVYRNYYDIGIAVGGGRGLVVPVLRSAERMSVAEIERAIADFAQRAKNNRLELEELQGGTFTISNGGVYGSLLSTPIVNPPQSGILGLHAIQDRPVARDGAVVIRPMMYVAVTYDHRLVDGRESVTFLKRVKECIETPARIFLEV